MKETSKSVLRRARDPTFIKHYFKGDGIDIGSGDDPLGGYRHVFPLMKSIVPWDQAQGDALLMEGVKDDVYDFVHSSHCLEHLTDPIAAVSRWLQIVKPGGYVIITVPDEDLYEKGLWPSRFNSDHKSSFTIGKPYESLPKTVNVLDLAMMLIATASVERIALVRDFYNDQTPNVDQTAYGLAECAIEIVLRKWA